MSQLLVDDHPSIQDAFDCAVWGDVVVFAPNKVYALDSPLTLAVPVLLAGQNARLDYAGAGTALRIGTGSSSYIDHSRLSDLWVRNVGAGAIGIDAWKLLRGLWSNVRITGFADCGLQNSGGNGTLFQACDFSGNGINLRFAAYNQTSDLGSPGYVPANANRFYDCTFNDSLSGEGVLVPAEPRRSNYASASTAGFHGCWIENNASYGVRWVGNYNGTLNNCRFEANRRAHVRIEAPIIPSNGLRFEGRFSHHLLDCTFSGLFTPPTAEGLVSIGPGVYGTSIAHCYFDAPSGQAKVFDQGTETVMLGNQTSSGPLGGDTVVAQILNIPQVSGASGSFGSVAARRLNIGAPGARASIVGGAISVGVSSLVTLTGGGQLQTITGGVAGDLLILQIAAAREPVTLVPGGNLMLPGPLTLSRTTHKLMLLTDGSRWEVLSLQAG